MAWPQNGHHDFVISLRPRAQFYCAFLNIDDILSEISLGINNLSRCDLPDFQFQSGQVGRSRKDAPSFTFCELMNHIVCRDAVTWGLLCMSCFGHNRQYRYGWPSVFTSQLSTEVGRDNEVCLDIPFYRTGLPETGNLAKSHIPGKTSLDLEPTWRYRTAFLAPLKRCFYSFFEQWTARGQCTTTVLYLLTLMALPAKFCCTRL